MKITKITVTSEAVLNYQKSIYSMEVELDEADDIIECTKNAQRIARSAALASVKSMSNEINGTTVNKTIEKPQTGKKEYYYKIRENFNMKRSPNDFMFLSRTCANGLIRFNSKNEFNSSFHFSRKGINPDKLRSIMLEWSNILNAKNVQFICKSYNEITPKYNDFVYLDPPYANTTGMYYGTIDYEVFWNFLRELECEYMFSFDGTRGNIDNTYNVPTDVYKTHEYLYSGISAFKKIQKKQEYVKESLYISY